AQAREERPRVPRRRGERDGAVVAAAIVEVERESETRDADPLEPDARDDALDEPAEDEEERLHRVERALEVEACLDRAGEWRRGERTVVLTARGPDERGAGGTEARRDLGNRQPGDIAERPHAPSFERRGDRRVRREARERQGREKAELRPGRDD